MNQKNSFYRLLDVDIDTKKAIDFYISIKEQMMKDCDIIIYNKEEQEIIEDNEGK